jgi:hypothetical protein
MTAPPRPKFPDLPEIEFAGLDTQSKIVNLGAY